MDPWRIRMFGAFAVSRAETTIDRFDTQRSAKLLALLALSRNGRARRDDLADLLWPDDFPDATRIRLRQELSRLRRSLGPAAEIFDSDNQFVWLEMSKVRTDLEVLRRTVDQLAADAVPPDEVRIYMKPFEGEFLPGWEEDWATAERIGADRQKTRGSVIVGQALLGQNDAQAALEAVAESIQIDPTHEEARMVAIRAQAMLGNLAGAMAEFQQLRREMRTRLGTEPSQDSQNVVARIAAEGIPEAPAATVHRPSLPLPIDSFFGREEELTEIEKLLQSARLVTLVGPGGIGKSRLALESANRMDCYQSKFFAALSQIEDPTDFGRAVCEAAGLRVPSSVDPIAYLSRSVSGGTLAVLDNLEQLLPSIALEIKRLLETTPNLCILATSRTPVGISGERVVPIGPLPLDRGAQEMLFDLWKSVRPGLKATEGNLKDAAFLASKLDGYPLALRLAAAQLKLTSPRELAVQLESHPSRLRSSAPDLELRHRSLQSALEQSIAALAADEAKLLTRLAWFRSGCTLYDMPMLTEGESSPASENLFDASLVVLEDEGAAPRVRMLEPIRQFIAAQAPESEVRDAERSLLAWAFEKLERAFPHPLAPMSLDLLDALDAEHENFLAAEQAARSVRESARLASRLWRADVQTGRLREVVARWDRLHSHRDEIDDAHRAAIGLGAAGAHLGLATEALGLAPARDGLESARRCGDRGLEAVLTVTHGLLLRRAGTLEEAVMEAQRGFEIARGADCPIALAHCGFGLGTLLRYANEHEASVAAYATGFDGFQSLGEEARMASCGIVYGAFLVIHNPAANGREVLEKTYPLVDRLADPHLAAYRHEIEGRVALSDGRLDDAEREFGASLNLWRRLEVRYQVTDQLTSLTRVLIGLGRILEARQAMIEAARGWLAERDWGGLTAHLTRAAEIALVEGKTKRAAEILAFSAEMRRNMKITIIQHELDYFDEISAKVGLPDAKVEFDGNPESAMAYFADAVSEPTRA